MNIMDQQIASILFVVVAAFIGNVRTQSNTITNATNPWNSSVDDGTNPTDGLSQRSDTNFDTKKFKETELESSLVHTLINSAVSYKGKYYTTLDSWDSSDTKTEGCQKDYLALSTTWSIAPRNADSISVIGKYAWGTDLLVLSDGS